MNIFFKNFLKRMSSTFSRMASILAPSQSPVDEMIPIIINELVPKQNVSILAEATRNGVTFSSFANYEADESGQIDLTRHSAQAGGCYEGVEPMGLFWSMDLVSELKIPYKMLNGNDLDKWTYDISVLDGFHNSLADALNSIKTVLTKTSIDRMFLPQGVRRFNVYYGRLRGCLFLPEGDGKKFPAVIDIFGGANGLVAYRGGLFARNGYACLSVAYAAYADLPKTLDKIEYDYFHEAVEFLVKHPAVDENRIGAFGSCLGATIGLAMARCEPKIKAVVAVSPEAFAGTIDYHLKENGKRFVVPGLRWKSEGIVERDGAWDIQPVIKSSVEATGDVRRHYLDYGKIKAPLLFFFGEKDAFFKLELILPLFKEQFDKEKKTDAEIVTYPGAGHIIQPPHLPMFGKYYSPYFQRQIWFGGDLVPHVRAQEHMWLRTLDFFRKNLPSTKASSKL